MQHKDFAHLLLKAMTPLFMKSAWVLLEVDGAIFLLGISSCASVALSSVGSFRMLASTALSKDSVLGRPTKEVWNKLLIKICNYCWYRIPIQISFPWVSKHKLRNFPDRAWKLVYKNGIVIYWCNFILLIHCTV